MTYDPTNIFAKILRGEIPVQKVYEDAHTLVIMDAFPQAPGHTLVIPKNASRNLLDADPNTLADLLPIVQRVARAVLKAFAADGVKIVQFNEAAAGQSVFHLHVHVIPVRENAPLASHGRGMEHPETLAENAELIRKALTESGALALGLE